MAWMAWTWPTAAFFSAIVAMLVVMTLLERWRPTRLRKGVLPLMTTRGDRLFLGLLTAAYVHLGWLAVSDAAVWIASLISVLVMAALLRWG